MIRTLAMLGFLTAAALACSGGGSSGGGDEGGGSKGGAGAPGVESTQTCEGACPQQSLSTTQVQTVVVQAVAQVQAAGLPPAVIAVLDRVGNVLAVFQMPGASATTTITSQRGVNTGLEGFQVPSTLAAISKAGTAAYLSSQGNSFTTRTASQIIQQNFNPGVSGQFGGPLFGVQFSQLPCGDLVKPPLANMEGPKPMPLGFSGDPGGLPLYVNGVPVGAVGVEFNGLYTLDPDVADRDTSPEERVATAATNGFQAPDDRRADRISVGGLTLRFADDETTVGAGSPPFSSLPGGLVAVPLFYDGALHAGAQLLTNASGIVSTTFQGQAAEVMVKSDGSTMYSPTDSTTPPTASGGLTANEVQTVLGQALAVAARARSQIRRPLGSAARVNVSVVDLDGTILGIVRSPDAPIFGLDVSLQKARSVALFGQTTAAASFAAAPSLGQTLGIPGVLGTRPFSAYVDDLSAFTTGKLTLKNGIAWGDRSIGNLARPFFPDGINGNTNGPLSKPFAQWSPFSTGLQLEVSITQLALILCSGVAQIQALLPGGVCPAPPPVPAGSCTAPSLNTIRNGLQIFAGSVPIFRGGTIVGAIGVSGDGIDQDDIVAFLGLHNAGQALGGAIGNAPPGIRTDTIAVTGGQLRYVNCPVAPFNDSQEQTPCIGK